MKNSIAVGTGSAVYCSPHVGDLETPESMEAFETVVGKLPLFLNIRPDCVATDLHPDMRSSQAGAGLARQLGIPVIPVQHHHAHAMACLAENGVDTGLALVFDGTGYGDDGTIWGAELFHVHPDGMDRLASFDAVPLPGGETAVREPARQLAGRAFDAGLTPEQCARLFHNAAVTPASIRPFEIWFHQIAQDVNCPQVRSAGRLFDAFAALIGIAPDRITYEGQPAIRLEAAAHRCRETVLPELAFSTREANGLLTVSWRELFADIDRAGHMRRSPDTYAMAFHHAIIRAAAAMIDYGLSRVCATTLAISGGCFMNRILHDALHDLAAKRRMRFACHRLTPPNDGCIAFGQAVASSRRPAPAPMSA